MLAHCCLSAGNHEGLQPTRQRPAPLANYEGIVQLGHATPRRHSADEGICGTNDSIFYDTKFESMVRRPSPEQLWRRYNAEPLCQTIELVRDALLALRARFDPDLIHENDSIAGMVRQVTQRPSPIRVCSKLARFETPSTRDRPERQVIPDRHTICILVLLYSCTTWRGYILFTACGTA